MDGCKPKKAERKTGVCREDQRKEADKAEKRK